MQSDLPHNIELEQQILGGLLQDNTLVRHVGELKGDAFHDPFHGLLFERIIARIADDQAANAVTMRHESASLPGIEELGGVDYLKKLQLAAAPSALMVDYLRELRNLFGRRAGIQALSDAMARLREHDVEMTPEKALEMCEGEIAMALQAVQDRPLARAWLASSHIALQNMVEARESDTPIGLSTGISRLDHVINAMGPGETIVIAGRPSMGKTALALNIALKTARRGDGVFFASLEMGAEQLALRSFAQLAGDLGRDITYFDMRRGKVEEEHWGDAVEAARMSSDLPIYTVDPSCRALPRLRAALSASERQLRAKGSSLKLIVVDYLQLVDPAGRYRPGDTNGRVTAASQAMKAMAMHYGVPVLVLSQLSRQVEMRDPPVPQLSDLRDSGSIEQDADIVLFCYRAEYYTQKKIDAAKGGGAGVGDLNDLDLQISGQRKKMTIICAKNRQGATGAATVYCDIARNVIGDEPQREMDLSPEDEFA